MRRYTHVTKNKNCIRLKYCYASNISKQFKVLPTGDKYQQCVNNNIYCFKQLHKITESERSSNNNPKGLT